MNVKDLTEVQHGEMVMADLHSQEITIHIPGPTFFARAGKYAVMPQHIYENVVEFIPSDIEIADQIYEYSGGYSDEEALKHYKAGIEWILSKIHPKK